MYFYLNCLYHGALDGRKSLRAFLLQSFFYLCVVWLLFELSGSRVAFEPWDAPHRLWYLGLTQILCFTSAVECPLTHPSVALTTPRPWLLYLGSFAFGKQLMRRLGSWIIFLLVILPFSPTPDHSAIHVALRFVCFLPLLTVLEILHASFFFCLRLNGTSDQPWKQCLKKLWALLGGAFYPLHRYSESSGNKWFGSHSPMADLFFQPCYYSVYGRFYGATFVQWSLRVTLQIFVLTLLLCGFYPYCRTRCHGSDEG